MKKNMLDWKGVLIRRQFACLLLIMMSTVLLASGCSKAGDQKPGTEDETESTVSGESTEQGETDEDTILSVGDYSYKLEDMMYYIYAAEEIGWATYEIYSDFMGDEEYNYWEEIDEEENMTGEEILKKEVISDAKKDLVWYQEALKSGITMEEEDKTAAKEDYDSFCEDLTEAQMNTAGMGEELLAYFEKQQVIEKYKENLLEEAEYDEEAISGKVSKEDTRQYVFEYLEVPKYNEDDKEYSKAQMKEYLQALEKIAKKLDEKSDMESMIPDKYKDIFFYSDDSLVESESDYYGIYKKVDIDKELKKLKNGEVSRIFETEDSYFVARMKDNNSTEYYEETVMDAVETARNKIYDTAYKNAVKEYKIVLNEEKWSDVTLGNLIYGF